VPVNAKCVYETLLALDYKFSKFFHLFQFLLNKSTDVIRFCIKQLSMNSDLFIHLYKFQYNCKYLSVRIDM